MYCTFESVLGVIWTVTERFSPALPTVTVLTALDGLGKWVKTLIAYVAAFCIATSN